jgi:hypothetical protein
VNVEFLIMRNGLLVVVLTLTLEAGVGSAQPLGTTQAPTDLGLDAAFAFEPVAGLFGLGTNDSGCHPPSIWFSAEYLLWWFRNGNTPPLVTTGDPADSPPGALDQPGTSVLFGGANAIQYDPFSGTRLTIGAALDDGWSMELSGFLFEQRAQLFSVASDSTGNPPIYIPFMRNTPAQVGEAAFTIADPVNNGINGNVSVAARTRLWGAELNFLRALTSGPQVNVHFLAGFRYLGLDDSLTISGAALNPTIDDNQSFEESFHVHNQFYGGQLGAAFSWYDSGFSLDVIGKLALGLTHQTVSVAGSVTDVGAGAIVNGSLPQGVVFAMPSNIGHQTTDQFSVVPHVQIKLGYDITRNLRGTIGYDFLYWSQVLRAGDQIDRRVNDTQALGQPLNGDPLPSSQLNRTYFYAQGLSFGLEYRY